MVSPHTKKVLRIALLLLAVSLISLAAFRYYWHPDEVRRIVLTGVVDATQVAVSAKISGRIERLWVDEGSTVQAGDPIALIDHEELQRELDRLEAEVKEAEARMKESEESLKWEMAAVPQDIERARAALRATEAQREEVLARLERARKDHERIASLVSQGILAVQERDRVEADLKVAGAAHRSAVQQVEEKKAALELALANSQEIAMKRSRHRLSIAQLEKAQVSREIARVHLGYARVRSPLAGLVSTRIARQGEVVNAGSPIVTVIDVDHAWIRADVEESYIDQIRIGQELEVRLLSGRRIRGRVFYKGAEAGFATARDVSGTKRDIKTFAIKVAVDNRDRIFFPGMTAEVILWVRSK
ncbi:MAG: HlyD family secretion protein [Candidatus Tectomicrobia bacterium]|uniref:HlyD family secretion protein n=1 Tax=Tectimicrobiota bacterium TaxID=2528274 RepID=A0A932CQM7_UNCTE|nr:HlyD family secretion protein [Candidatus Tectomicrobia bacterium]